MTSSVYVGVDISKSELVVATAATVLCTLPNDRDGHRDLVKRLRKMEGATVVVESTGCYGRALATAIATSGITIAVVQPGLVRHFAKSRGILAKTDAIDAKVIAQFGESNKPRPWSLPAAETTRLRALVDRRDQIVELRKQEQNHLETCADSTIATSIRKSIARLAKLEKQLDAQLAAHLQEHEPLRRLSEALQGESGVGLQTAANLIAYMPELGSLNRQKVAAMVGFAPYNKDSGKQEGKRSIQGGRRRLRRALYMAAISASRFNPWISTIYQRLIQRGKPKKVALVACGRKLAIRLNSIAAGVLSTAPVAQPG